ncbi:MAG: hypothetical protein J6K45_06530 [Clostridia bacterium]|nr:hypothetical protein [Clostridia bacterium]
MNNLEKNKMFSFGYEDTDKKIEIELYGLVFEINNFESIGKLENINKNDKNDIEAQIDKILGSGAVEKINKKRNQDGYKNMDIKVELNVLGCIFEAYGKSIISGVTNKVSNTVSEIENNVNNFNNKFGNREQRRKKGNNYNREYRKGYRRY